MSPRRLGVFARGLRRASVHRQVTTTSTDKTKLLNIFDMTLRALDTTSRTLSTASRELNSTKDRLIDISGRLIQAQDTAAESKEKMMLLTRRVNIRSTTELIISLYKVGPVGVQQVIDQIVRGHCNNFRPMGIPFQQALNQAIPMVIPAGFIEPRLLRQAANGLYHTLSKTLDYYGQHAATLQLKDNDFAPAEMIVLLALIIFYKAGYQSSQLVIQYTGKSGLIIV
ncbi:hypothetical protein C8J56DRAFT_1167181 [Mycena floridula]|nr:hypothetical protein C8J56DRAFT_1167181 [Mycena floridula]